MHFVNLNGEITSRDAVTVSSTNSTLRYGFGLFETMLVENGVIALANYHWERLWEGMKKLNFDIPAHFTRNFLEEELLKTIKKNPSENRCRVRLQIFTQVARLLEQEKHAPHFLIECFSSDRLISEWNEKGLVCGTAKGIAKQQDDFSNLKTCAMQPYMLAAQQANLHKWDDVFIQNQQGNIIESSIANIFWIKDEKLFTPPLSEGCIAGVMRRYILEKCREMELFTEQKPLTKKELEHADEVFLTNSIRKIKWVSKGETSSYGCSFTKFLYGKIF